MDWFLKFITDFVSQPSIVVGIFVAIGLVVTREKGSIAIVSVFKTIAGFIILSAGVRLASGTLEDFSTLFMGLFNINGVIPNTTFAPLIAGEYSGIQTFSSLLLVFTFMGNLFLASFTRFKYMFLAGPVLYFLCIAMATVVYMMGGDSVYDPITQHMTSGGLIDLGNAGEFAMMLIGSICIMSMYTVMTTALLAKNTAKITGTNAYSVSFTGTFSFLASCKLGQAVKKYSKREIVPAAKIKIPRYLKLMSNPTISMTAVMLIIFYALFIPAGIIHDLDVHNARYFNDSLTAYGNSNLHGVIDQLHGIQSGGWKGNVNSINIIYSLNGANTALVINKGNYVTMIPQVLTALNHTGVSLVSADQHVQVANALGTLLTKNNWVIKAFMDAFTFTAGVSILMFGVQAITHELIPAFKGFQKCCRGVKPALSPAVLMPFEPNALLIGFISSIVTGLISMAIGIGITIGIGATSVFQPGTIMIVVPFMMTLFFVGGYSGMYANIDGGYKGAIAGGALAGIISVFLPLIILAGGWVINPIIGFDQSDYALMLIPGLIGMIPGQYTAEILYLVLPLLAVIALLIDGWFHRKDACKVCAVSFKSNDQVNKFTPPKDLTDSKDKVKSNA